jgi:hypothetical protein
VCEHITRVQLPYLCCVMMLCSLSSVHSASLKILDWKCVTMVLVILRTSLNASFLGSIPATDCREL